MELLNFHKEVRIFLCNTYLFVQTIIAVHDPNASLEKRSRGDNADAAGESVDKVGGADDVVADGKAVLDGKDRSFLDDMMPWSEKYQVYERKQTRLHADERVPDSERRKRGGRRLRRRACAGFGSDPLNSCVGSIMTAPGQDGAFSACRCGFVEAGSIYREFCGSDFRLTDAGKIADNKDGAPLVCIVRLMYNETKERG